MSCFVLFFSSSEYVCGLCDVLCFLKVGGLTEVMMGAQWGGGEGNPLCLCRG